MTIILILHLALLCFVSGSTINLPPKWKCQTLNIRDDLRDLRLQKCSDSDGNSYFVKSANSSRDYRSVFSIKREIAFNEEALKHKTSDTPISLMVHWQPGSMNFARNGDITKPPWIAFKYYPYGDLLNLVNNRGPLSFNEIQVVARNLLLGASYLKSLNPPLIHGDIKPQNIIINSMVFRSIKKVKLIELEHAKHTPSFNMAYGTTRYSSPEILKFHAGYKKYENEREQLALTSEMYAIGLTLFSLYTGSYPYDIGELREDYRPRDCKIVLQYQKTLTSKIQENVKCKVTDEICSNFKDFLIGLLEFNWRQRFDLNKALNHPFIQRKSIPFLFK